MLSSRQIFSMSNKKKLLDRHVRVKYYKYAVPKLEALKQELGILSYACKESCPSIMRLWIHLHERQWYDTIN